MSWAAIAKAAATILSALAQLVMLFMARRGGKDAVRAETAKATEDAAKSANAVGAAVDRADDAARRRVLATEFTRGSVPDNDAGHR